MREEGTNEQGCYVNLGNNKGSTYPIDHHLISIIPSPTAILFRAIKTTAQCQLKL